jgi:HSP20 family protein
MEDPIDLFGDITRARREMEHLMQHMIGQPFSLLHPMPSKWRPNVDVFESEESVIVVIELAGVNRENVSLTYDDGKLYVNGVRKDEIPYRNRKYCQMEINYNDFERVVYLPENIEVARITAKLNNGLMIVEAPKRKPEGPKSQQVQIG